MLTGLLSDHFDGVAFKYLSEVEINSATSNQHEFNGVDALIDILGPTSEKKFYTASFFWADDDSADDMLSRKGGCTWSDVRRMQPQRSPEYRLYYSPEANDIVKKARPGDILFVAKRKGVDHLLIVLCDSDSVVANNFVNLFGISEIGPSTRTIALNQKNSPLMNYLVISIFGDFGLEFDYSSMSISDTIISQFGSREKISTWEFSHFTRMAVPDIDPVSDPDWALYNWMTYEEIFWTILDTHRVSSRIHEGFLIDGRADVNSFMYFAKSILNRRKSRAGYALSHHTAAILDAHGLRYTSEATTEKKRAADFLFPGEEEYHNSEFDPKLLTMLAAKTTCRERWRQVLSEAYRIGVKHLLTMDHKVSESQLNEMNLEELRLVLPKPILSKYAGNIQSELICLADFLAIVKERQTRIDKLK